MERLQARQVMEDLATAQNISREKLLENHTQHVVLELKENCSTWNQNSLERIIFNTLMLECGKFCCVFLLDESGPSDLIICENLIREQIETLQKFFLFLRSVRFTKNVYEI